jgi:hypothetical protein
MSKKVQSAARGVQRSAQDSAIENAADRVTQDTAGAAMVRGRALIDLPAHGLQCGEFGALPADAAERLAAGGAFDPLALAPADSET